MRHRACAMGSPKSGRSSNLSANSTATGWPPFAGHDNPIYLRLLNPAHREDSSTKLHPYGPTAARKHGKPGRELRPKSTTIDIHSHVGVPAAAAALVKPHLDPS